MSEPWGTQETKSDLSAMWDLSFKKFITISIIQIIYVIGIVLIAIGWLIAVISAFTQGAGAGIIALVVVTIIAVLYLLFWRVWLELIVVLFRIAENTSIIAGREAPTRGFPVTPVQQQQPPPTQPPPAT